MNDAFDNARADRAALEALAEEDLSDEAVEGRDPERSPGDSAVDAPVAPPPEDGATQWEADVRGDLETSSTGDTFDAETGEVLKDAPGWKDGQIQNVDGLDWAGEKISETCATIRENERLRDAAVERLQRRIDLLKARTTAINSPLVMRREFFEKAVAVFAEAHRAEVLRGLRKGAKSRTFPSGLKLAWRTEAKGGAYRWDEKMKPAEREAALLAWAKAEQGKTLRPLWWTEEIEHPKPDAIKAHLAVRKDETLGSVDAPPGLEYVPEHEELKIAVEDDK